MFCKAESRTRGADYQLKRVPDKRLFLIDRRERRQGEGGYRDKVELSPGEIHVFYSHLPLAKTDKAAKMGERTMHDLYEIKSNATINSNCIV